MPVLLAKLWSVIPLLYAWPPLATPAQAVERAALALLVGSAGFELATGVANMQYWYPFGFNFVVAHYYGAVVFVASLAVHVVVKAPVAVRAFRARGVLEPLRADLAHTAPEPEGGSSRPLRPPRRSPAAACWPGSGSARSPSRSPTPASRSAARCGASRCSRPGGSPRPRAERLPGRQDRGGAGVTAAMTGDGWRLRLRAGRREVALSRADLLAMPQRTETLPIACVEGWSTTQRWTGVPLAALAELAGAPAGSGVFVESLQPRGPFRAGVAVAPTRSPTSARCSRCGSTAPTCRPTTATPPA